MTSYMKVQNRMVGCPYDESHRVKESRLQAHITKCRLNHLDVEKKVCPFNAQHRIDPGMLQHHLLNCPDKAVVERKAVESNTYKGFTGLPGYSQDLPVGDECWDLEIAPTAAPGYIPPRFPPNNGIIEPTAMMKPAERRDLYKRLHTMHGEPESAENEKKLNQASLTDNTKINQNRQPKELEQIVNMQKKSQADKFQNLGLGRASNNSRIAANIFGQTSYSETPNYSEITNNMSLLGVGRGRSNPNPSLGPRFQDADFPELGFGRGARRPGKGGDY